MDLFPVLGTVTHMHFLVRMDFHKLSSSVLIITNTPKLNGTDTVPKYPSCSALLNDTCCFDVVFVAWSASECDFYVIVSIMFGGSTSGGELCCGLMSWNLGLARLT